jgi:hypothetical protein
VNTVIKVFLTGVVVVLGVPGLVIEPGPFSEIITAGLIASIWGLDWSTGGE